MILHSETARIGFQENNNLEVLDDFNSISLNEMNGVKLLNRYDSKYWFNTGTLPDIFEAVKDDYSILDIDGTRIQIYKTLYFDTPDDLFYIAHHNGQSNRIKIRKRKYVSSGISFLEIKQKNNKGKTSKKRMPITAFNTEFSEAEQKFIRNKTNINAFDLEVKYGNTFKRITLVSKDMTERCTIDFDLSFRTSDSEMRNLNGMTIIETKLDSRSKKSILANVLKENKIYENNFSKYCMGRALTETSIKRNRFKPNILRIEKQFSVQ